MPACVFLATLGPGDLLGLVADTTFFGKFILLTLLVMSVTSWAVFIDKARHLARIRKGHLDFWTRCEEWLDGRLDRSAMRATTSDESTPPDRSAPTGTSAIRRSSTASRTAEVWATNSGGLMIPRSGTPRNMLVIPAPVR